MFVNKYNRILLIGMVLMMGYTGFTFGLTTGAEAAQNDSVTPAEFKDDLDTVGDTARSDLRENTTGIARSASMTVLNITAPIVVTPAKIGVDIGYSNPTVGQINRRVAHPILFLMVLSTILYQLRTITQGGIPWR